MRILVFIKQIPDTSDVKLDPITGNLLRAGVKTRINPADMNVIEAAIQLKEKLGGTVCAVSMGPPQAKDVLMKALALGCDEAHLLSDRAFGGADTLATAYTLSKAAEKLGDYDLILTGRNSDDGDTAQIGAAVAAYLDVPQVTLASEIDIRDGWAYCSRAVENAVEKVRVRLPAVVTICKGCNDPRFALPANILSADEKPFTTWDAAALNADVSRTGHAGSPSSTKKVFVPPKSNQQTEYFSGNTQKIAAQFVDVLCSEHLV